VLKANLCRCTGYVSIFRAIRLAAGWLKDPATQPGLPGPEPETIRVVGASVPKIDALAKVRGAPIFANDLQRPNVLHGKLVHGNIPCARVVAVDTETVNKGR
jgi:xanthine dehydrogenase iron-sulfur cluster and FAD-binding subunit A